VGNNSWKIIKGERPLLVVAGHNFPQIRLGKIKPGDMGTGEIAEVLCAKTKTWGIISTRVQLDPNWYHKSVFRQEIKELIRSENLTTVLDIHGKKDGDNLIELYPNNTFRQLYNGKLKGWIIKDFIENNQLTISEDLDSQQVACAELEIRRDGRGENSPAYEEVLKTISNLVGEILRVE